MSRLTRALSFMALTMLVLAGCGPSSGSSTSSRNRGATFEATICPVSVTGGALKPSDFRCGYLVVPENRGMNTGRTIKVAVAVIKTEVSNPAPDPVVNLVGGPGTPSVATGVASAVAHGVGAGFLWNRDLVLVDQRGAGLSQPSLACHSEDTVHDCRLRLGREGIDLSAYNTVENAADIGALRTALGYQEINLTGVSYGSTLALQIMRDHPQGIRSVMLNGVAPPTFNMFNHFIPNTWHALHQIFTDCAAARDCNTEYPHLAQTFTSLLARLQTHPVHLSKVGTLDAVTLWWWLNNQIAVPENISSVPYDIQRMAGGDFSPYTLAQESQPVTGSSPVAGGMYESMECSEDQAESSPARIAARAQSVPVPGPVRRALVASQVTALNDCLIWRVPSTPPVNHTFFDSAIPTLLMPGRYDPKTSSAQAYPLARHLGRSYVVPFPTMSHEIDWTGCPAVIMTEFLAHPYRKPDTSCVAEMTMVWQ